MKIPHELGLKRPSIDFEVLIDGIKLATVATANRRDKDAEVAVEKANAILSGLAQQLAAVATIGWKMQKRMTDPQSGETRATLDESDGRKLARDVQSLLSTLTDMGITIRDRTGQIFDYGMPEKVIDAKTQPGITKERVVETLRPTITWTTNVFKETMIQKGEVIIQTPQE